MPPNFSVLSFKKKMFALLIILQIKRSLQFITTLKQLTNIGAVHDLTDSLL